MLRSLGLIGAIAATVLIGMPSFAADQRPVFQGLNGMPAHGVNVLRQSFGKVYLTVPVYRAETASNRSSPAGGVVVSPVQGKISLAYAIANASADPASTDGPTNFVMFIGSTQVQTGSITIATGTALTLPNGTAVPTASATPTASNSVSAGDVIRIESDGGNTTMFDALIVIEIDRNQ